jgi:hypothetical protein
MKRTSRTPSELSESLHQRLNMYALAASAAGVGLLASADVAEARVIYTATHTPIPVFTPVPLDLNHDGINDMTFNLGTSTDATNLRVSARQPTGFIGYSASIGGGVASPLKRRVRVSVASALKSGVRVGPKGDFRSPRAVMYVGYATITLGSSFRVGPWANVKHRYLGVKFVIKGKKHYGWVRLTTNLAIRNAVITGYAYETIPNKSIIAGQTKGPDVVTVKPGSLGALAAGASRLQH